VRHAAFISGALALAGVVRVAAAADITGYAVLTTDYVWRGVTQSDGDPAIQLGGDVSFSSGFYAGIWGSTIDIDNGDGRLRDTEVNYYLGYRFDAGRRWTLGVSAIAYTYPGQKGAIDYDYEELILSANFDDRLWFEYAWSCRRSPGGRRRRGLLRCI
jgi:uncharacterized protein (TIGR02001 family)